MLHWTLATPIWLSTACGCFHDTMAEVSSGQRPDGPTGLKYLLLALYREGVPTPCLKCGPQTHGIGITRELVGTTASRAPPPGICI